MIIERAYAKVNILLAVKGKRPDGYHELESLMVPIDFYDTITIWPSDTNQLRSNQDIKDNIVLRARDLFMQKYHIKQAVTIHLDKRIPLGAGLGGGSADASATLRALNRLFKPESEIKELEDIANQLGSDTLFCLYNRQAIITGRGEYVRFIAPIFQKELALKILPIHCDTSRVYQAFRQAEKQNFKQAVKQLYEGKPVAYNDLEAACFKEYPELAQQVRIYRRQFACHLSGSGSSVFSFSIPAALKAGFLKVKIKART